MVRAVLSNVVSIAATFLADADKTFYPNSSDPVKSSALSIEKA